MPFLLRLALVFLDLFLPRLELLLLSSPVPFVMRKFCGNLAAVVVERRRGGEPAEYASSGARRVRSVVMVRVLGVFAGSVELRVKGGWS